MKKKSIFLLLLLSASFWGSSPKAWAQSGISIKISPIRFEEIVDPGMELSREIKVANESDTEKTIYAYLKDFVPDGENGAPRLIEPGSEEGNFLSSWVSLPEEGIVFGPREEKYIQYTVRVPANIGPGGYYGGIYFGTVPPRLQIDSEDKGAGMAVAQQTGALLLFQVKGAVDERAEVREFMSDRDFYGTPFEVKFSARIENQGNVHIKPYGTISIRNMWGREVAQVRVNEKGGNVLPASTRRFEEKWAGKFGFGRYLAQLGMTYGTPVGQGGQGMNTLTREKYFWIIPWRIVLPVTAVAIILLALFFLFLRFYRNKAVQKAMQRAGIKQAPLPSRQKGQSEVAHFALILLSVFVVMFLAIVAAYFLFFA